MAALAGLRLSKLYRFPVFHSQTAVNSHQPLSKAISNHGLLWGRGRVNTSLFRLDTHQISLMSLGYGAEVEIQAHGFKQFCLVQMPLRGQAEFISDGVQLSVAPGEVAILSPQSEVHTLWQAGCEQLILKVPHSLFDLDVTASQPSSSALMPLQPARKISPSATGAWYALVHLLLDLAAHPKTGTLNPRWLQHLENSIALFILQHQAPHAPEHTEHNAQATKPSLSSLPAPLSRALDYVYANLDQSITLSELCAAAGTSARTLHLLCRQHYGESPMSWVRGLRLDLARKKLKHGKHHNITEVALSCGFQHLGRFAAYYRARFHELPRQSIQPHP